MGGGCGGGVEGWEGLAAGCTAPAYEHSTHPLTRAARRAVEHWAKIEVPDDPAQLAATQARLAARYPVAAFNAARQRLDPHNILGSPMIEALFPRAADGARV